MIKMLRIDERLIHGQVALIWSKHLDVNRIIVVNEKAANDSILSSTLKMATPSAIKVIILNHEDAKKLLSNPKLNEFKILIVVNSPKDALFVCQNMKGIESLNVGNYGRVNGSSDSKEKINDNLYLNQLDKRELHEVISMGVKVQYQLVPEQPIIDLSKII